MNWSPQILMSDLASGTGGASPGAAPGSAPAPAADSGGATSGSGSSGSDPGAGAISSDMSEFSGMDYADDLDSIDLGATATDDGSGAAVPPSPAAEPVQPDAAAIPPGTPPQGVAPTPPPAPVANVDSAERSPLETAIEGFKTNNAALSAWAAQNLFQLSKEDAEALETDAVAAIPQLLGRVYTQALAASTNLIRNFVPNMIQQGVATHQQTNSKAQEALSEFYASNRHLDPQKHGEAVTRWAKAFRAANPKASRKEAIDYVGRAVGFEFGLTPGATPAPQAVPFAPARPGARTAPPAPSQGSPYDGLEDLDFD